MVLRKARTTAHGTAWAGCWAWITWCHVFYKVQRITTPSYWIICKIWTFVFGRDAFKVLFIKMNKSSQVPVPSFNNFWTRYWDPPSFLLNPFSSSFLPLTKINVNRWVSEHICLENNDIASILFVAPFLPTRLGLPLGLRGCIASDNALVECTFFSKCRIQWASDYVFNGSLTDFDSLYTDVALFFFPPLALAAI